MEETEERSGLIRDIYGVIAEFFTSPRKFIKRHTRSLLYLSLIASLVGVVVGFLSVSLKELIETILHHLFGSKGEIILGRLPHIPYYYILLIPTLGGLAVGILKNLVFRVFALGGVEQVMAALSRNGTLSVKETIETFLASIITLATGGSAGKEGPMVHIGGGIGSILGRFFGLPQVYVKALVGAGAAAGIGAAFNAPIAGAFFALEILIGDFSLNIFCMVMLASIAGTSVSRFLLSDQPTFVPPPATTHGTIDIVFYIILGISAAFVTIMFIKSMFLSRKFFSALNIPPLLKPALGGLMVGLMALIVPNILGVGIGTINTFLDFENSVGVSFFGISPHDFPYYYHWLILAAVFIVLIFKSTATAITLGSGGTGGTIVPSLFLGAVLGALVGQLATILFPAANISIGAFVLIGMSSIIAGTTQAPIMSIVLFFEITRSYQIIIPVAIVTILASQIAKFYLGGSLYNLDLREHGIHLYEGMEKTIMSTFQVSDIMRRDLLTIPENMPLSSILDLFMNRHFMTAVVLNREGEIVGKVYLDDVKEMVRTPELYNILIASEVMEEEPFSLPQNASLSEAFEVMGRGRIDMVPVTASRESRIPIGFITRKDIIRVYQKEILRKNVAGIKILSPVDQVDLDEHSQIRQSIDFSHDYAIKTVTVPRSMVGKSLAQVDLRRKFGVTVLALMDHEAGTHIIPRADYLLGKSDLIVIAGDKNSVMNMPTG